MADSSSPHTRRPFFAACAEEPFRIFFPLGTLVGISGVSLWPLFFSGVHHSFYPGVMHARMMVEGFLGAFVFGFLGTAFPRFVGAPHLTRRELGVVLTLYVAMVGVHVAERSVAGDAAFVVLLLAFMSMLAVRFQRRRDMPPPGFVLVLLGLVSALSGALLSIIGTLVPNFTCVNIGKALLHVGWFLLLVLGLGGILIARFLHQPEVPESRTPPPGWWPAARLAGACGLGIMATFVIEGWLPASRVCGFVRWIIATGYLVRTAPFYHPNIPKITITGTMRTGLELVIAALLLPVCWPPQTIAWLHLLFVGSLSLLAVTVGTRVIFGHSGLSDRCNQRLPFLVVSSRLILTGMTLRVIADFLSAHRPMLMNLASAAWMAGVILWGVCVLPKVRRTDPQECDYQE